MFQCLDATDVLLAEIPAVLRSDLYAVAALSGATIVAGGRILHLPPLITATCGGLVWFGLRLMAIRWGWHLPIAGGGNTLPWMQNNHRDASTPKRSETDRDPAN